MTVDVPVNLSQAISYDRSTSQQLFEYILDEIISRVLSPGEKIPENQLAEKFGVSRTPVRAALAKLSAQGFVEIRPQRGTFVTKLSMQRIKEAFFIREALEIAVVRHLANNSNPTIVDQCEKIVGKQRLAAAENNKVLFQRLDEEFHTSLADAIGFQRVSRVVEAEKAHMDRGRNFGIEVLSDKYDVILQQHDAILGAIKTGSAVEAAEAMGTHMRETFKVVEMASQQNPEYFL